MKIIPLFVRKYCLKVITVLVLLYIFLTITESNNYFINTFIDCDDIINGSKLGILRRRFQINESYSGDLVVDSQFFVKERGYFDYPISQVELDNKLAYIIVVYKNSKQFERLFRSIYRTSNVYCIHVDLKSSIQFWRSIKNLTRNFENVFLMSNYKVVWGTMTTLLPEIDCMKILLQNTNVDWKYAINLTGEEFPLKSNYQLARITKALNGSNWIGVESLFPHSRHSKKSKKWIPYGLTLYKGPVHSIMSRGFVEFVIHNEAAQHFLKYLNDTEIPDETFYATLNFNSHILKVPGAYNGTKKPLDSDLNTAYLKKGNRFKLWKPRRCYGFFLRDICIFGSGDIRFMIKSYSLFANKFNAEYEPKGLECLESWIMEKSFNDYLAPDDKYYDFYSNLEFTKYHI